MSGGIGRRAERRFQNGALLLVGCLLCACRTMPPPTESGYFPMVPGARWVYELRSPLGNGEIEVRARGSMLLPGHAVSVFVMDETVRGSDFAFVETSPVAYVIQGDYVARIGAVDYSASNELLSLGEDPPTLVLPLDPRPGQRWSQRTTLFGTAEGPGAFMGWTSSVRAAASLRVPAGRFDDVLEVRSAYRDRAGGDAEPRIVYRDYYARGVGLVRSVAEDPSGDPAKRVEQVLIEYRPPQSD